MYEDSDYVKWLELNHPEAVPADRYSLVSSVEDQQNASGIDSLVDHFSEVNPLGKVADNIPSNSSVNNNSSNTPVVSAPRSESQCLVQVFGSAWHFYSFWTQESSTVCMFIHKC